MQTVYLKDGRMADMVTKTEKGYLVDPYISWNDYEGQPESAPSGNVELVSEIFDTAPIELIEAEYKKVLDRVSEQEKIWEERQKELRQINVDISRLKNQKTDLSRYIVNREELRTAKRLIIWPTDEIAPRIMDGAIGNKFSVSYEISQYKGEERCWCYKVSMEDTRDQSWSTYSQYFDEKYGIKVDLTDEEILALTHERISRFEKDYHSWRHTLLRTDDKWLTADYIAKKQALKEADKKNEMEKAKKELQAAQEKINKLTNNELAVS